MSDPSPEIKVVPGLTEEDRAAIEGTRDSKDSGLQEAKQLSRGLSTDQLKQEGENREHDRNERFKDHFETVTIIGLYLIALLFFIVGLTWFYHLLTPDAWHFLNSSQVDKLQNFVTGGVVTGIVASHVKKRLS